MLEVRGVGNVWSATQIDDGPSVRSISPVGGEIADPLELERVFGEPSLRFVAIDFSRTNGIFPRDLAHFFFEGGEVFRCERLSTSSHRKPSSIEGRSRVRRRPQASHRGGEDVRAGWRRTASDSASFA